MRCRVNYVPILRTTFNVELAHHLPYIVNFHNIDEKKIFFYNKIEQIQRDRLFKQRDFLNILSVKRYLLEITDVTLCTIYNYITEFYLKLYFYEKCSIINYIYVSALSKNRSNCSQLFPFKTSHTVTLSRIFLPKCFSLYRPTYGHPPKK